MGSLKKDHVKVEGRVHQVLKLESEADNIYHEEMAKLFTECTDPVSYTHLEEMGEFKEAIAQNDRENMEKEAGDVLFSLINLLRWYKISGENALNRTNTKFRQRFLHVESCVNQSDR